MSAAFTQDEEDQAFIMDDAGNIEASQTQNQTEQRTMGTEKPADMWDNDLDDQEYLDSLNEFEKSSGEISDGLLLSCMADFDSQGEVHAKDNI